MILSEDTPDLAIEEQFGAGEPGETKSCDPLLERILAGQRLALSGWQPIPTTSKVPSSGPLRARQGTGPRPPEFQEGWLRARAEKHGFRLKALK